MKNTISSLKQPNRYIVGILMTKAKISSMKVFRAEIKKQKFHERKGKQQTADPKIM